MCSASSVEDATILFAPALEASVLALGVVGIHNDSLECRLRFLSTVCIFIPLEFHAVARLFHIYISASLF